MWRQGKFLTTMVQRSESVSTDSSDNSPVFKRRNSSFRHSFRRPADFSDIQHLTTLKEGIKLSDRQKMLVRQLWAKANSKSELPGKWVVRRLFTHYPAVRKVFGIEDVSLKDIDSSPIFIRHSEVVQNVLEMTIASLDALDDQLGPLLYSYGCRHVAFERQCGFRPEMWQSFADVMCQMAKKWRLNTSSTETFMAWRLLVLFVTAKVQMGFEAEKNPNVAANSDLCTISKTV